MIKHNFDVTISGSRIIDVPICHYDYVNIVNNTSFPFALYNSNSRALVDLIGFVPPSTVISLPHPKTVNLVNVTWDGPAVLTPQRCSIYYTNESLGWGSNLNPLGGVVAPIPINITSSLVPQIAPSRLPVIHNLALPLPNTQYSVNLGVVTRFTCFIEENNTPFRIAYESGRVALPSRPFLAFPTGASYSEKDISQNVTLFVAVGAGAKNFTVVAWG